MRKHGHRRQELPYSWEKLQLILDHLFNQLTVNLIHRIEAMHAASGSSYTNEAPLACGMMRRELLRSTNEINELP